MNSSVEQRLKVSGIQLPPAPKPLGAYVEAVQVANLLFVSGALPLQGGVPQFIGRLGGELSSLLQGNILDRWTRCSVSLS
jgi:enamine deaminase RidA (YjgF/YER057c/UK114 family)